MWQLYTEGIAMYFTQKIMNDFNFYHQDKNGWKSYFDEHLIELKKDFHEDCENMTKESQRYFGDWVFYHGYNDVGYYLDAKFIQFIYEKNLKKYSIKN